MQSNMIRDAASYDRLHEFKQLVLDISRANNPQELLASLNRRVGIVLPGDHRVSLSRQGMPPGQYRVTASTWWKKPLDPWLDRHRHPVIRDGLLARLAEAHDPFKVDDIECPPDDPTFEYMRGMRSLIGTPLYHDGHSDYFVFLMRAEPAAFSLDDLGTFVLVANLVGRATRQLILSQELREAHATLDRELESVGRLQRSLLPQELPKIRNMRIATHYETSTRAGGDYYDFFQFADGQWGILLADVSGHGAGPAVVMAMVRTMMRARFHQELPQNPNPGHILQYLNRNLVEALRPGQFVTAFLGLFNEQTNELRYASAGHPAPRWLRRERSEVVGLDGEPALPLGIVEDYDTFESSIRLEPGDRLLIYTDGYTETFNPQREMFGIGGIDEALSCCSRTPGGLISAINEAVRAFANGAPADDDRTLVALAIE